MTEVRMLPYNSTHLTALVLQNGQENLQELLADPSYGRAIYRPGLCFTGVLKDRIVGCAGIIPTYKNTAQAWALLSNGCAPHFLQITRYVDFWLDLWLTRYFLRIETHVDENFEQGHRWVKLLGFTHESFMPCRNDGKGMHMYRRLRDDRN